MKKKIDPGPLEKDIECRVVTHAKSLGFLVYKFTSPARRSVPDRMFVKNKTVFFAEFKRRGKLPTLAQQVEIGKIQNQGIVVYVIDDVDIGKLWISNMDEEITLRESRENAAIQKHIDDEVDLSTY